MESNPLISVIIPVYKAEEYIGKCINSVISQTFTNWELILIDDGSPDASGQICDEYAKKDSRIGVFHQINRGVSAARNVGIDKARGKYICFIDSDDWVEKDYLEDFLTDNQYLNNIFVIQKSYEDYNHSVIVNPDILDRTFYCRDEYLLFLHQTEGFLRDFGGPCCKLYCREILLLYDLRFIEGIATYEDCLFNLSYLFYTKGIYLGKRINYHYMHRGLGVNISSSPHHYSEYFLAGEEGINMLKKYKDTVLLDDKTCRVCMNYILRIKCEGLISLWGRSYSIKEKISVIRSFCATSGESIRRSFFPENLKFKGLKVLILTGSPWLFLIVFQLYYIFKRK